ELRRHRAQAPRWLSERARVTEGDLEYASRVAREVVLLLEARSMKVAIGGAIACGVWGSARGTNDADLNVFVGEARYAELQRALEQAGLGPEAERADWTPRQR